MLTKAKFLLLLHSFGIQVWGLLNFLNSVSAQLVAGCAGRTAENPLLCMWDLCLSSSYVAVTAELIVGVLVMKKCQARSAPSTCRMEASLLHHPGSSGFITWGLQHLPTFRDGLRLGMPSLPMGASPGVTCRAGWM